MLGRSAGRRGFVWAITALSITALSVIAVIAALAIAGVQVVDVYAQTPAEKPAAPKQAAPKLAAPKPAAPKPAAPKPPVGAVPANIDRNGVLILIRSVLLALDQANKTGNYTVLRDLGAPGFQANSAAKLAEIFASQRAKSMDLGGVAVLDPQLTLLPQIEPNGMLHMAGFFPSTPLQVNFELLFAPADRQWKIFGLSVNVANSVPQAPPTQESNDAAQKKQPPPRAPSASVGAQR